jgi:hypothetical protein
VINLGLIALVLAVIMVAGPIRGGNTTARANIILGVIDPNELAAPPVAAAMSHAELVGAFQIVGEQFAIMQETQTRNNEQIAALANRLNALQRRSFVDRLLNREPAIVVLAD